VRTLVLANQSHPGIRHALRYLEQWLDPAEAAKSPLGLAEYRRLAAAGVTAMDVLIEAATVVTFSRWFPHRFKTRQELVHAIARAVLFLAPGPRYSNGFKKPWAQTLVRRVGSALLDTLSLLLVNIAESVSKPDETAKAFRDDMAAPFMPPVAETAARVRKESSTQGEGLPFPTTTADEAITKEQ
jgi:hypothetical protein